MKDTRHQEFRDAMGAIVRKYRTLAGISYRELERLTGLDSSTVHDIENSRAELTVFRLHRLAHILGPDILQETYGYVVRRNGAPRLVKKAKPSKKQIDEFMRKIG